MRDGKHIHSVSESLRCALKVLSVGEVLWDVFPDKEFLGGAPLNVCANLRRAGDEAALLSAVGDDIRGHAVLDAMVSLGLLTDFIQVVQPRKGLVPSSPPVSQKGTSSRFKIS